MVNRTMSKSFEIIVKVHLDSMFIGVSGVIREEDMYQFESSLRKIEETHKNKFIFDFSKLESIPKLSIVVLILMQMESRKKGKVFTLAPTNHLKEVLLNSGAIRDGELLPIQNFGSDEINKELLV